MRVTDMKERPILFSGEMVRAILEGRKTMTRRVVTGDIPGDATEVFVWPHLRPMPHHKNPGLWARKGNAREDNLDGWVRFISRNPYGWPGDRLWVREAFSTWHRGCHWYDCTRAGRSRASLSNIFYRATHHYPDDDQKWVPGIFMPRWASRITLEITGVRIERLKQISHADAEAEGLSGMRDTRFAVPFANFHMLNFIELWDKLNAKRGFSWESNPFVWVLSFRRLVITEKQGASECA